MASAADNSAENRPHPGTIPPLASGDRLTRPEFERRYAVARNVRAELVEGVVYVQAAIRHQQHGQPHALLSGWLTSYFVATNGTDVGDASTLRLDADNEPQPDILLRIDSACGGASSIDKEGYLTGPPELVVEVAASTVSYDLHDKLNAYRRNGVQEYLVWRVLDDAFDWFVLREGRYERLPVTESGVIQSQVFPGLLLDTAALLGGDLAAAIATLKPELDSAEHAAFCQRLQELRTKENNKDDR